MTATTATPTSKSRILRSLSRASALLTRPLSGGRLIGLWAIVHHVGRRSGTAYATPVATIRVDGGFLIPLPFGSETQWARNVLAARGCTVSWHGAEHTAIDPEILAWDAARPLLPARFRLIVPAVGIKQLLRLREA
jgi:deazaflavin-dependent oxidoreductase (nitroreductase family)